MRVIVGGVERIQTSEMFPSGEGFIGKSGAVLGVLRLVNPFP
jgi:hypothetical protein